MKFCGGYDVFIKGRPSREIHALPEPKTLYLPIQSRFLTFSTICVEEGQRVAPGTVLAKDPDTYHMPMLAPREGTVRLSAAEGHIVLEDVAPGDVEARDSLEDSEHIPESPGSIGIKRYKLLNLGAWQFFRNAHTGAPVDPFGMPTAVIVSTLSVEPFSARGDAQLRNRLLAFTRGLEQLQALLEYEAIYLVLPDIRSSFATKVRETIRGYAWAKLVDVLLQYPFDHPGLIARRLGLRPTEDKPVWAVPTAGVLALDRALTLSKPVDARIVSVAGPSVAEPMHVRAVPGYPLKDILAGRVCDGPNRVLAGGVLTGREIGDEQLGLDVECTGLTVLPEHQDRELFGFMRPGFNKHSYSHCFLSSFRGRFLERVNTALRGELRPCVACGQCVKVCPAGIMPNAIHKLLYQDELEQAQRLRVDLCVDCGLCAFVCPSKMDLRSQFLEAKAEIIRELQELQAQQEKERAEQERAEQARQEQEEPA